MLDFAAVFSRSRNFRFITTQAEYLINKKITDAICINGNTASGDILSRNAEKCEQPSVFLPFFLVIQKNHYNFILKFTKVTITMYDLKTFKR